VHVPRLHDTVDGVEPLEVLDEINRLLAGVGDETVNTSMRLPAALRDAAALAVAHLGVAPSTTALAADALRHVIETAVMDAALQEHYERHPHARPSLTQVAAALAEQDGSPLAGRPDLLEAAAAAVTLRYPDADAHDVLLRAEALQASRA
jgi:hypothetical protein